MEQDKQIELLNQLKAELSTDPDIIINIYRDSWLLIENKKRPGYFIYLEIGEADEPHLSIIYEKINCFYKQQVSTTINLGSGDDISQLIEFAKNPVIENRDAVGELYYPTDQLLYLNELYIRSKYDGTKFDNLKHIAEERHGFILNTLQHIEMRPNRTETGTVLRFINDTAFFDYDPDQEKIVAFGTFPRETISQITSAPDPFDLLIKPESFRYRLLSRMQADCEYYLGYGNRYAVHLWTQNEADQIIAMRLLWNSFPNNKKPEWLSLEQINDYATKMEVQK